MLPRYRKTFQAGAWRAPEANLGPVAFAFSKDCSMSLLFFFFFLLLLLFFFFVQYFFGKPWTYTGTFTSKKFNMKYICSSLILTVFILEICALLGNYAAYSGNSLPTFQDNLPHPFSRGEISRTLERATKFLKE
jgi:ABC-type spermidine/putrescine transport system permease subunit I